MDNKKIVKLAIIREMDEKPCPFGLYIPDGCLSAGDLVDNMSAINNSDEISEEDKNTIIKSNNRILMLTDAPKCKCKYANRVFKSEDEHKEAKVECSFGDTAAGIGNANFNSTQPMSQYLGLSFYSLPIGYYNQDLTYQDGFTNIVNQYFAAGYDPALVKESEDKSDNENKK